LTPAPLPSAGISLLPSTALSAPATPVHPPVTEHNMTHEHLL
jgi:hypothetical protein